MALKQMLSLQGGVAAVLGLVAAVVLVTIGSQSGRVELMGMEEPNREMMARMRPYNGQQLFTINDFETGRVSFDEHGLRGVNQVTKSLDTNLGLNDHKWEHQTTVSEAPMQEWPLTTAGMKGKRAASQQLAMMKGYRATNKQLKASSQQLAMMNRLQFKAAKSLSQVGTELDIAAGVH
mmetsp:Transcript_17808/g.27527  ORF Transcript_17808/g.27527 Transcript_17808/m.27527 type:complete len:178 (-) Transcript_17808:53-586(-)|eukprot:CAMPEP_0184288298 /NCGR_PEP_ID=MMETSP1049-20130417/815_1 /TAXON_ID=77928 /ORGANISM="Proteomonas sulcata, Strain CCMP704" /LENGTH=177 /DNA_ID=CAMNT_0026594613 /DNA_START=58 /DNA_END=591 /DNA_ORIENTATION=-